MIVPIREAPGEILRHRPSRRVGRLRVGGLEHIRPEMGPQPGGALRGFRVDEEMLVRPVGPEPGVEVDVEDGLRPADPRGEAFLHDPRGLLGPVPPVEEPMPMLVLPDREGLLELAQPEGADRLEGQQGGPLAGGLPGPRLQAEGEDVAEGLQRIRLEGRLRRTRIQECVHTLIDTPALRIGPVVGEEGAVVEEVAVEVDVVLVPPAPPGEPEGVQRVDEHDGGIRRDGRLRGPLLQPGELDGRPEVPFDPVEARGDDDHPPGIGAPEDGGVDGERLAVRPAGLDLVDLPPEPVIGRRRAEAVTRGEVVGREVSRQ